MIILVKLLLAHFIGDFLLQPKSWVEGKENLKLKSPKLYLHAITHGVLTYLFLWDFSIWLLPLTITLIHFVIDLFKLYIQKEDSRPTWFFIDQLLHIISIVVLWLLFCKPHIYSSAWFDDVNVWIYATAIIFITVVSGIIVRELMYNWSKSLNDDGDKSLKNAGKYIGILERLLVFIFVVTGHWEGIGFLLAAKSVFRFGDLKKSKDRKLTEYILVGTLLSLSISIVTGLVVLMLVGSY